MKKYRSLLIYFTILILLCTGFVIGAKMMGEQGMYLAQGYMMTPALAAIITRLFFYENKFKDANLRLGRGRDYLHFWALSLGITLLSYGLYTLLGSVSWDFSGQVFLDYLAEQFAATGQDINDTLPPGFTPHMMLLIFFIGGLTVFNILPGLITGFGEEFGHRGLMFSELYRIRPWVGIFIGGFLWYAWHWPLILIIPQTLEFSFIELLTNWLLLGVGSIAAFIYLAYVYVKSESVWVASVAHITMNNAAASFSYFAILENQMLANLGLAITMVIVVLVLYWRGEFEVFTSLNSEYEGLG